MARANWGRIRAEYVTGRLGQRELAKKHGVSASQLAEHASKEGWVQRRREHRRKTAERAEQKAMERQAEDMADKLDDVRKAGDKLAALIAEVSEETSSLRVGRTKKVDTRALRNLTGALKDVLDVIRDVNELPTLIEKNKLDAKDGAGEFRVVFENDPEEEKAQNTEPQARAEQEG